MRLLPVFAILLASAAPLSAQIANVRVTASDSLFSYNAANLVNGSGLTAGLHDGDWNNKWLNDGGRQSSLTFDLRGAYQLSHALVWNYGGGCCGADRNVRTLDVLASLDGSSYDLLGSFSLTNVTSERFAADLLGLNGRARYVRFDLTANQGSYWTGLSEVQFNGTAVPEPASWAMMILGVGASGTALRRRRRMALAAA